MHLSLFNLGDTIGPMACLVCIFKQQFSVFLKIRVGEKVCENTCNVI